MRSIKEFNIVRQVFHPQYGDKKLDELEWLNEILEKGQKHFDIDVLDFVAYKDVSFPIHKIVMGNESPDVPALAFVGGVHGIEKIGSHVVLSFLDSLIEQLKWDKVLKEDLKKIKLVFVPLVNPLGFYFNSRSNANGVDLMRNSPVNSKEKTAFLVGGHRISNKLPWYRGEKLLEKETSALIEVIRSELLNQKFAISVDCHSGFGFRDRMWFPYAKSKTAPANLCEYYRLMRLFKNTYPNHDYYFFEPQSKSYLTHGDLWDFLYDENLGKADPNTFLPLTLEMGSWTWLKKNLKTGFVRYKNLFNPILPHRKKRVLRRHLVLFDFLMRLTLSYKNWLPKEKEKQKLQESAFKFWNYKED